MTEVVVWDERDDYTACTYRSILMVIAASGFTAFPLGAYTAAEAQAFRGGDTRLHFGGPVDRALARYDVQVGLIGDQSQAGLRAALSVPGNAYAVAGKLANFAAGHPIRRWDPVFAGFHAVCVIPLGGGLCQWLDPLAYTGFAGDQVSVADVVDTFAAGNYPNDARYLPATLESDMTIIVNATMFLGVDGKPALRQVAFAPGAVITGFALDGSSEQFTAGPGGSSAPADARCAISGRVDAPVGQPFIRITAGVFDDHPYLLETQPGLTVAPDPKPPAPAPTGFTQEDVTQKVTEATTILRAEVQSLEAQLAAVPATPIPAPAGDAALEKARADGIKAKAINRAKSRIASDKSRITIETRFLTDISND